MPLRTRVYIDGFNLYYGRLRKTPYKWLDLVSLFENQILPTIPYQATPADPPSKMVLDQCAIKYFTAPIVERAAKATDSVSSQARYFAALEASGRIAITRGYYSLTQFTQRLVDPNDLKKNLRDCTEVNVWKLEEKQSDVNLALALYDDALSGDLDQLVVVTNDTDIAPALAMIRQRRPGIVIGLVVPTKLQAGNNSGMTTERQPNADLRELANWTRKHIADAELAASQLPRVVQGKTRASIKPISWYPRPDLLEAAMQEAKPIKKKAGEFFEWAESPNPYLGNERPLDLLATDDGAVMVMQYIQAYIENTQKG